MIPAIRKIVRYCVRQGARVVQHKHIKLTFPNGRVVVISGSPSDRMGVHRIVHDLEKAGIDTTDLKF